MTTLTILNTREQTLLKRLYEIAIDKGIYFFETHSIDGKITHIDLIDPEGNRVHNNEIKNQVLNCTNQYHEQHRNTNA
jgi:uncharacterized protein YnzC (UPF0291/DUF896 family)